MPTMDDYQQTLKDVVQALLEKLCVTGEVAVYAEEMGLRADIISTDSALLIGWRGSSLAALEYITRILYLRILGNNAEAAPEIHVDIGGYKQRQLEELTGYATQTADQVRTSGQSEVLRPMNAYERRVVHMALKEAEGITTESIGVDPSRRIVIKPKA